MSDGNIPHTLRFTNLTAGQKTTIGTAVTTQTTKLGATKISDMPINGGYFQLEEAVRKSYETAFKTNKDSV